MHQLGIAKWPLTWHDCMFYSKLAVSSYQLWSTCSFSVRYSSTPRDSGGQIVERSCCKRRSASIWVAFRLKKLEATVWFCRNSYLIVLVFAVGPVDFAGCAPSQAYLHAVDNLLYSSRRVSLRGCETTEGKNGNEYITFRLYLGFRFGFMVWMGQ